MSKRISQLTSAATLTGAELVELSQLSSTVTKTATTISADSADNSFNDSGNGFVTAGFTTGKAIKVSGFTGNTANNIVSGVVTSVAAGKIIIGGTDGDVIVTDAAGESVTITQWDSKRSTAQDVADLAAAATGRELLAAARTYYVRTDGSDSNNGLANTAGGAFLTIQKAVDTICDTIDTGGYAVTVQVADGTYTGAITLRAHVGRGIAKIQGNSGTPANVIISTTSSSAISSASICEWDIADMKVQTTTSGYAFALANGRINIYNVNFGACASGHLRCYNHADVLVISNCAISGAAPVHWLVHAHGRLYTGGRTYTITGTPAFSTGFAKAYDLGMIQCDGMTFSGSATGKRYTGIATNGVINTNGGGATYLPGDTSGDATATGGQYV